MQPAVPAPQMTMSNLSNLAPPLLNELNSTIPRQLSEPISAQPFLRVQAPVFGTARCSMARDLSDFYQ
jgi:hypothetical protein